MKEWKNKRIKEQRNKGTKEQKVACRVLDPGGDDPVLDPDPDPYISSQNISSPVTFA